MITIETSNTMCGNYTAEYLTKIGHFALYQIFGTNRYIAIENFKQTDKVQVLIRTTAKVPLYKQAMDLQMGRPTAQKKYDKRMYNLVSACGAKSVEPMFKVYKIVYGV